MNNKTIIFYAPLGSNTSSDKIGGAEAGCLKTLDILKKGGHKIILLEKPVKNKSIFTYGWDLIKTWFLLISMLCKNRDAILHVAGFYLNLVAYEWLLIKTAEFTKHRSIYEIRNGGMIEAYQKGGKAYKYFMLSILKSATEILCQGSGYVDFIKKSLGRDSNYYPNYIMDKYITENNLSRNRDEIKLIFFGRIVPSKNINLMIDICAKLRDNGVKCALFLIGGYTQEYRHVLNTRISELGIPVDNIIFEGRQNFDFICNRLKESHFFLFPSQEKREGHSNSLTEAMGCGVVPVVSNVGFNSAIVDDEHLVISSYSPFLYAEKILEIWNSGQWEKYSQQVYNRVIKHFTESIVSKKLLSVYDKM